MDGILEIVLTIMMLLSGFVVASSARTLISLISLVFCILTTSMLWSIYNADFLSFVFLMFLASFLVPLSLFLFKITNYSYNKIYNFMILIMVWFLCLCLYRFASLKFNSDFAIADFGVLLLKKYYWSSVILIVVLFLAMTAMVYICVIKNVFDEKYSKLEKIKNLAEDRLNNPSGGF